MLVWEQVRDKGGTEELVLCLVVLQMEAGEGVLSEELGVQVAQMVVVGVVLQLVQGELEMAMDL